jgi:hypothetical protein
MVRVSSQTSWYYSRIQTKSLALVSEGYFRISEERALSGPGSELTTDGGALFIKFSKKKHLFLPFMHSMVALYGVLYFACSAPNLCAHAAVPGTWSLACSL